MSMFLGTVKRIHLTEKGKQLEERLWNIKKDMEALLASNLSSEESSLLVQLLTTIKNDLQQ